MQGPYTSTLKDVKPVFDLFDVFSTFSKRPAWVQAWFLPLVLPDFLIKSGVQFYFNLEAWIENNLDENLMNVEQLNFHRSRSSKKIIQN